MPFKAQVPPGSWAETNNCGQTSSLMVFSYWNGTVPTEQGIKDIDDWLYTKYGDPVNGYNGSISTTTKLESLAREYGGFSTYKASGWDLNRLKRELDAGHPVIVAVIAGRLSNRSYTYSGGHFVVVKGYSSTHVICNDPGTSGGHDKYYANTEFSLAMSDQGGSVVVIAPPPTADFSADPVYAIEDQVVHFTGLPSGGILPYSYAWDFGDGTTANDQNPSHAYSAPGSYPVSLTITDSTSATTSKTKHVTVWGVKKYAPTLRFDDKENYYPTDVHGDDGDVTNNHENWDAGKFGSTRVCYYNVVTYPDSVVYEYWYYYANNAFPLDNHEHDFEAAFVWVNNATNKPFYFGLTQHQWINESEISDTSQLVAYVELGGHGMADSSLPISGEGDGTAISGNNFTYQPMSAAESFAGADLDDAGNYKTNEFSISHVKAPWQRADYANPEGEIRLTEGLGQTNWITIKLHSPGELRVLDSQDRTTGIVGGETRNEIPNSTYYGDAVTILSPVDSYRYEVVGTGQGSYGLTVTLVKDTGPVTFAATDIPILANGVHQYTIDWDALSLGQQGATIAIDSNGDGTVDNSLSADAELTHEEFLSATSEQGLPSWIWIVVGVAAAVGVGVVAYLVSSRRAPKQG
ncbi:MAG: C39 family peptidase [Chloroflexi bacterium]|nr:C39 family peptidase [Chloroflexota bacterium]